MRPPPPTIAAAGRPPSESWIAGLLATRIVREAIVAIDHAVAVAIAVSPLAVALVARVVVGPDPGAAHEVPGPVAALLPVRRLPAIAWPRRHPFTAAPDIAPALPGVVARRPEIALPRGR